MIEILDRLAIFITVFGAAFCFLLAIGQLLIIPRRTNQFVLAAFLVMVSLLLLNLGLTRDYILRHIHWIHALHVPFYYLAFPLFSSYISSVVQEREFDEKERLLVSPGYITFLPFTVALLVYIPYYVQSGKWKIFFFNHYHEYPYLEVYRYVQLAVIFGGLLSTLYHILKALVKINALALIKGSDQSVVLWHLRGALIWFFLLMPYGILITYFDSQLLKRYGSATVSMAFIWLYLLDYRYPGFFIRLDREIRSFQRYCKYEKSKILGINIPKTIERLEHIVKEERLFIHEDITLEKMASVMNLTSAQLSELLNNVMEIDFRSYINRHRIAEAKRMLLDEPDRTILSIAYAVGFNSKSSFNRNFRSVAGKTPAEFRSKAV